MTPEERIRSIARRLYQEMPGAEQPPRDERGKLWGEVEHTDEYFFCEQIGREIDAAIREAVAAEREACAKVADACEAQNLEPVSQSKNEKYVSEMLVRECRHIATAIRSRGEI